MRASGRGGRQGPRGDRIPPRALVAFMRRLNAHRSPSALGGACCARPVLRSGGAFSCARGLSALGGFPMRGMFIRLGSAPRMRPSFAFWDGYR